MICSMNTKRAKGNNFQWAIGREGLVVYERTIPCTIRYNEEESRKILHRNIDFSRLDYPCEVAHLEISDSCDMDCKYCYVGKKEKQELSTREWKSIIENLSASGIFQVSFGGGEPTLRKDLFQLASYVAKSGMNLGMTTNGNRLDRLDHNKLKKYFKQINVSWHQNRDTVQRALSFLYSYGIPRGINYCYSKEMAKDNYEVNLLADLYKAELLYLVYKPVIKDKKNQVPPEKVYKAAKASSRFGIKTAVDGPCVNKCLAKKKFIDVDSLGNVYPCSFIRKPLGNLLKQDFKEIWRSRGRQDKCPYVKFHKEGK